MESFEETVAQQQEKIKQMEEFISLYMRKKKVMSELKALSSKMEDVKPLVDECSRICDEYYEIAVKEHTELMEKMREQQLTIFNIIKEVKKKKLVNSKENVPPLTVCETPVQIEDNVKNIGSLPSGIQRMYLSDYKRTPLVSRLRPVSLQFLDFEVRINNKMFESIPKYLRGRETFEEFLAFLNQAIVPCFTEKYQILFKKRSALKNPNEIKLWELYREQEDKFPGQKFITQGDLCRTINKLIDKKITAKIAMLRHLGILKEKREQSTVYYLWIYKAE